MFEGDALGKTVKNFGEIYTIVGTLAELPLGSVIGGIIGILLGLAVFFVLGISEAFIPLQDSSTYYVHLQYLNWLTVSVSVLLSLLVSVGVGAFLPPIRQARRLKWISWTR